MIIDMEQSLLPVIREAGKLMTAARDIGDATKEKGGDANNLVTEYDVAVQNYLMEQFTALVPNASFFAEEKENNASDLCQEACFVIDPIDGTANFVHDYKKSAISVALFSRGEAVFAAVYDPYLEEMFWAVKGRGAFLNDTPIRVSQRDMAYAYAAFGTAPYYKSTLSEVTFRLAQAFFLKASDVRRSGTAAIDLAYVAAGRNDIFFEMILQPWDYAAGSLLITEAGGIITDLEGKPLDYSKPSPILAAASRLYPGALEIARTVLNET